MTAGVISNSHMTALRMTAPQTDNKPLEKGAPFGGAVECLEEKCGIWDDHEKRCGLIVGPSPRPGWSPIP